MRLALAVGVLLATCVSAPRAAATFDFLFSARHVRNDAENFLNLAVADSGYGRAVIEPVLPRLRHLERDLPVVLFLAKASGRPVDDIVGLRANDFSWSYVLTNLKLGPDILFAGIDRDPGPPCGKAWRDWKEQANYVYLSDDDIAGLVHVQLAARWLSTRTYDVANRHGGRKQVIRYVADRKGRQYPKRGGS